MPELYLVRHAQASFATEDYDRLSETGRQQAEWLGEYFLDRNIHFDRVASGDMQRHKQTIESINTVLNSRESMDYEVCPGFDEYDFMTLVEAYGTRYPEDDLYLACSGQQVDKKLYYQLLRRVLMAWQGKDIADTPERWLDFQQRVMDELDKLLQSAAPGSRVLVVSSGGPISMFIGLVLGISAEKVIDLNLQIKNSSISHFFFNKDKMNLHGFNAVPHLEHPQRIEHITYG